MFFCVYISNSKVSNAAREVHWGVKQASRVQGERFHWVFTTVVYQQIENSEETIKFTDSQ